MKARRPFLYFFATGISLLTIATFGTVTNTSCSDPTIWPTYTGFCGLLLWLIGLLIFFRVKRRPWLITISLSLILTIVTYILVAIINTTVQTGGILHCYTF
jgi:hypothetical protein